MDVNFTVSESKKLRVEEEEELMTYLREGAEEVKSHDPERIEQAVRGYRQAKGMTRNYYKHKLHKRIKKRLKKQPKKLVAYYTKIIAAMLLKDIEIDEVHVGNSIVIRCRCKTTDGLLDLDKLVDSGELDELFGCIMSCLINQQVTASVSISQAEFKRCLTSLTADAG